MEENLTKRHYHAIRDEHDRMEKALELARNHFNNLHKKHPGLDVSEELRLIDFLQHVLQFSSTWNGVETKEFFTQPEVDRYLEVNNMRRLGEFFGQPFAAVSRDLRARGGEYPPLLKKLYEAYFLRRSMPKKEIPIIH